MNLDIPWLKVTVLIVFIMSIACKNTYKEQEAANLTPVLGLQERDTMQSVKISLHEAYKQNIYEDKDGRFCRYKFISDTTALLEWGDCTFQKIRPDTIYMEYHPPHLESVSSDFITLNYSCGSPCWGMIVLPFDKKESSANYMYDYFYDKSTNLIGYFAYENKETKFVIQNIKTKKKKVIKLYPECDSAFGGDCIDFVNFTNRRLTFYWKTPYTFADSISTSKYISQRIDF
ncbi:hypothetical protein [Xanthocytophaga agilis]|uniref:Uncharacterized protein n=1 Tax=Xanthocytophaga agilis TaxID=3048010 RepID=A0AAE3QZW8_9BACT|nr:hypothetical protein [Xanthocytophaga agilis]MDJ1501149.1 hypothetical protein [Xanthocytophaga agilis]